MRIIDKQHDFYDYLQDPTDRIVFDRRGSFLLTKKLFCNDIKVKILNGKGNKVMGLNPGKDNVSIGDGYILFYRKI